jgi:hypothetical protein
MAEDPNKLPVERGLPTPVPTKGVSTCCKAELYPVAIGLTQTAFKCSNCSRIQDPKEIGLV